MLMAEKIAKMSKNEFYIWLADSMRICDPNGKYDIKFNQGNSLVIMDTLLRWAKDCIQECPLPLWLCLAIIKLNIIIKEGE